MNIYYKRLFLAIPCLSLLFLGSCDDEEDIGPLPMVAFTKDKAFLEVNESINFSNNSSAESGVLTYNWDFGDGTVNTSPNPSKSYLSTGTYTITLTATTERGASEIFTDSVTVGQRYLTSMEFVWADTLLFLDDSVNPPDTVAGTWDVGNGPDISVEFSSDADNNLLISTVGNPIRDVTTQPVTFTIDEDFLLDNETYTLFLLDEDQGDGPEDDFDESGDGFDYIIGVGFNPTERGLTFNPDNSEPGKNPDTGEGVLFIDADIAIGLLYFEIR